jgi:hypothetical protein
LYFPSPPPSFFLNLFFSKENGLPTLHVPENVTVMTSEPVKFNVTATDPDVGQNLTYKLVDDGNGALSIDAATGEITATLNLNNPVSIR